MKKETRAAAARQCYAAAYDAHYTDHDLLLALARYRDVMILHPHDGEADYSRMQVRNIVAAVVPQQELLDAQMELALTHLERDGET